MLSLSVPGLSRKSLRPALAAVLFVNVAQAAPETLSLSSSTSQRITDLEASAGDPETDWNCLDVAVGGESLRVIMPRFLPPNVDTTEDVLELVRLLAPETVLASSGDIGTQHQDGTIYGVEFKVFSADPNPVPSPPLRLDVTGTLLSDSGQPLGTMYCFNEGQYLARVATLGMLNENIVWCGSLGHGGALADKAVMVAGNENSFRGDLKANGEFRVTGDGHVFEGDMIYRSSLIVQVGSHTLGPQVQASSAPLAAPPRPAAAYQSSCDHIFLGDVSILSNGLGGMVTANGVAVSGLIYATGSISIEGNAIDARATFVAEEGVEFIGNHCRFEPAVDELLAYSSGDEIGQGISIPGSNLILTGALLAPDLRIGISGSSNQVFGILRAERLRIMGTDNSLSNVYQP